MSSADCEICGGTGYLIGQTYGNVDAPPDCTLLQRCDSCEKFVGDESAAKAAADERGWRFGLASCLDFDGHEIGDWWIGPPLPPTLVCPHCNEADGLATVQQITGTARVTAVRETADGELDIDFHGRTDVDWDSSTTIGWTCLTCLADFPLPTPRKDPDD